LHRNCTNKPFKPKEWEDISSLIEDYLKNKEKLENEKNQANEVQKGEIEQQIDDLKTDTAEKVKEKAKGEEIREFMEVIEVTKK
jgi:NMD protein affecting ribosome stability and mRNA decay